MKKAKGRSVLCAVALCILIVLPFGSSSLASYSTEITMTHDDRAMLAALEKDAGQMMDQAICEDMNRDGVREIVGVCSSTSGKSQIWLGGSTLPKAKMLSESKYDVFSTSMCTLDMQNETHIAVNMYVGSEGVCSIVALRADGSAWLPLEDQPGSIRAGNRGDILCCVDVYDVEAVEGHQSLDTYLAYDGKQYTEYAAREISMQELLKLDNAKEYLDVIECEQNDDSVRYRAFIRENGILELMCKSEYAEAIHYTLRYFDTTLYCNEGAAYGSVKEGRLLSW